MFNYEIISADKSKELDEFSLKVVVKDDPRFNDVIFEFNKIQTNFSDDGEIEASYNYEIRRQNSEPDSDDEINSKNLLMQIFQDILDGIDQEYSITVKE